jgi:hypothetical protein
MSLRLSRAIAVMVMVDTKTEVACSRPIMRHANWKKKLIGSSIVALHIPSVDCSYFRWL